jgi:hypothetical protein
MHQWLEIKELWEKEENDIKEDQYEWGCSFLCEPLPYPL